MAVKSRCYIRQVAALCKGGRGEICSVWHKLYILLTYLRTYLLKIVHSAFRFCAGQEDLNVVFVAAGNRSPPHYAPATAAPEAATTSSDGLPAARSAPGCRSRIHY